MPKIICTSRYIKNPKTSKSGGYLRYIGTREGVEKLTNASFTLDTYTHVTTDMQKSAAKIVGNFMDEIIGGVDNG